jgi:hypothetical protein
MENQQTTSPGERKPKAIRFRMAGCVWTLFLFGVPSRKEAGRNFKR